MSALYALLFGLAVAVYGYLIGGVSFARLIAKHHGVDITAVGSHNPGGTMSGAPWAGRLDSAACSSIW